MKTIGLLGGLSWESTAIYYRLMNELVNQQLGALHSASILLWSFDFEEIARLQNAGEWDAAARTLANAAVKLETAGADALVICSNTMHLVYPQVSEATKIPVIHIADPTASAIRAAGFRKVGLVATRFTMEQDFYVERFREMHGIQIIVPDPTGRIQVHQIIYDELCKGIIRDLSRDTFIQIIQNLITEGAEAIILGCTEIGMLISQKNLSVPVFDTTYLHAKAAVEVMVNTK